MSFIPHVAKQVNPEPQQQQAPVSHGARAFCSILHVYACAVGPRKGWSRFTDTDRLAIINKHLEADGKLPIGRATFYRWKGEARAAGLLDFKSANKRERVHRHVAGGRWMHVAAVPTSEGRRLRHAHETFEAPPLHETFEAPYKEEDLRDLSPLRDQSGEVARQKTAAAPTPPRGFSPEVQNAEAELTNWAVQVSTELGYPWQPLPEKRAWRLGAVFKTIGKAPFHLWREHLIAEVVGMAVWRGRDIQRANDRNRWEPFWEVGFGDIVARAFSYSDGRAERLHECGERYLWNLERESNVRREAAVGARR